jgi:hypothetical protein
LIYLQEKNLFLLVEANFAEIIKEKIKIPALKVCIVGPGGSGKSQLAFKASNQI